mmetsp:Transcript_39394/g.116824  ORF Transcript_39394/g.116824 Transcript_39394/m.116824 type:complete len:298 (-) Transcript_39394:185-1078(-)
MRGGVLRHGSLQPLEAAGHRAGQGEPLAHGLRTTGVAVIVFEIVRGCSSPPSRADVHRGPRGAAAAAAPGARAGRAGPRGVRPEGLFSGAAAKRPRAPTTVGGFGESGDAAAGACRGARRSPRGGQVETEGPDVGHVDGAPAHGARERRRHQPGLAGGGALLLKHAVLQEARPAVGAEAVALHLGALDLAMRRHERVLLLLHADHAGLRPGRHEPPSAIPPGAQDGLERREARQGLVVGAELRHHEVLLDEGTPRAVLLRRARARLRLLAPRRGRPVRVDLVHLDDEVLALLQPQPA